MSPDLTEHDHCRFCGDAVPADQAYCSVECYYSQQKVERREKRKELFWTVIAFAGVASILILGLIF